MPYPIPPDRLDEVIDQVVESDAYLSMLLESVRMRLKGDRRIDLNQTADNLFYLAKLEFCAPQKMLYDHLGGVSSSV